jgi:hypothetical protein
MKQNKDPNTIEIRRQQNYESLLRYDSRKRHVFSQIKETGGQILD